MTTEPTNDIDILETKEWQDALLNVIQQDGVERAEYIIQSLLNIAGGKGAHLQSALNTPYRNTIATQEEARHPGDLGLEQRIRALIRWNAAAMVVRGSKRNPYLKEDDLIAVKNSIFGKTTEVIREFTAPFVGIYSTKEIIEGFSD